MYYFSLEVLVSQNQNLEVLVSISNGYIMEQSVHTSKRAPTETLVPEFSSYSSGVSLNS